MLIGNRIHLRGFEQVGLLILVHWLDDPAVPPESESPHSDVERKRRNLIRKFDEIPR